MSTATLNIRTSPRRMLNVREAAEYCGLPAKRFPLDCQIAPVQMPSGGRLYDMRDLDVWIESLKSEEPNSDDAILRKLG
jgi:hypothetical protein